MTAPTLHSISIERFRGCIEPFKIDFPKGKPVTFIYGENGTGKSTICDAFELLASGRIGSLDNRGLGRTDKFLKAVTKKGGDPFVGLNCVGCECKVTVRKQPEWSFQDPRGVAGCDQHKPRALLLRRAQILELITAQPTQRYEAIGRFVNVQGIEASEAALDGLIKSLNEEQKSQLVRLQQSQDSLEKALPPEGLASKDPVDWARTESKRDFAQESAAAKVNEVVSSALRRLEKHTGTWKRVTQALGQTEEAEAQATKSYQTVSHAISADASNVVAILESAATYLAGTPTPAQCPLCESTEKTADLADRVTARIASFKSLRDAKARLGQAAHAREDAKAAVDRATADYDRGRAEFQQAMDGLSSPPSIRKPTTCPAELATFDDWYDRYKGIPEESAVLSHKLAAAKERVDGIKRQLGEYDKVRAIPAGTATLIPPLEKALAVIREERKAFTDTILSRIAKEVGRLYEIVHPGEGLDKISLQLDPKKRAALELEAPFLGKDVPPQAYFSESHLDTLGLCIFLALAKMEDADQTILIIDDVLASVDEPHVERLIGMIYDEAANFRHCIITTHYRPLKERYRWGWLKMKDGQCNFVELGAWSKEKGLSTTRSLPEVTLLGAMLKADAPDLQAICGKAGVILEAVLDFLTQKYETAVPRRAGGRYTLGELLPSISNKLRKALQVDVMVKDKDGKPVKGDDGNPTYETHKLGSILEELDRIAQTRNVMGAHFSTISFDMLDADAVRFSTLVHSLASLLTDEENGWPSIDRSGSYWATAGKTRRLHPLKEPS